MRRSEKKEGGKRREKEAAGTGGRTWMISGYKTNNGKERERIERKELVVVVEVVVVLVWQGQQGFVK